MADSGFGAGCSSGGGGCTGSSKTIGRATGKTKGRTWSYIVSLRSMTKGRAWPYIVSLPTLQQDEREDLVLHRQPAQHDEREGLALHRQPADPAWIPDRATKLGNCGRYHRPRH